VPLPFTLGILTGLLSFIPNIGPIFSAVLGAGVALTVSPHLALSVIGLAIGVQIIESYLVTPLVEQRMVNLPPALIILFELIMGFLFGFIGLLVATPLLVVIVILVEKLYMEDVLREKI
jgi:predicted PurR-regulated permease PerM